VLTTKAKLCEREVTRYLTFSPYLGVEYVCACFTVHFVSKDLPALSTFIHICFSCSHKFSMLVVFSFYGRKIVPVLPMSSNSNGTSSPLKKGVEGKVVTVRLLDTCVTYNEKEMVILFVRI
jgi:hypothetical protein